MGTQIMDISGALACMNPSSFACNIHSQDITASGRKKRADPLTVRETISAARTIHKSKPKSATRGVQNLIL